jgi:hypothetical protein
VTGERAAATTRISLFLLLGTLSIVPSARAQTEQAPADTVQVVEQIELRDGSRLIGTVIEESDTDLVLRSLSGSDTRIEKSSILRRRTIRGRYRDGEFLPLDPNQTRLFFAPTGRSLEKGQAYLASYFVVIGFLAVAVSDRLTLAGGGFLIPELVDEFAYVAPKLTVYEKANTSAAVGVLAGFAGGETAGVIYGVATRGYSDQALTLGLGFGFAAGDISNTPVLVLGYEGRLGRRVKFISEDYIFPNADVPVLLSGGLRFYGDRLAADLGFVGFVGGEAGDTPVLPWLSFAYNFTR